MRKYTEIQELTNAIITWLQAGDQIYGNKPNYITIAKDPETRRIIALNTGLLTPKQTQTMRYKEITETENFSEEYIG